MYVQTITKKELALNIPAVSPYILYTKIIKSILSEKWDNVQGNFENLLHQFKITYPDTLIIADYNFFMNHKPLLIGESTSTEILFTIDDNGIKRKYLYEFYVINTEVGYGANR